MRQRIFVRIMKLPFPKISSMAYTVYSTTPTDCILHNGLCGLQYASNICMQRYVRFYFSARPIRIQITKPTYQRKRTRASTQPFRSTNLIDSKNSFMHFYGFKGRKYTMLKQNEKFKLIKSYLNIVFMKFEYCTAIIQSCPQLAYDLFYLHYKTQLHKFLISEWP